MKKMTVLFILVMASILVLSACVPLLPVGKNHSESCKLREDVFRFWFGGKFQDFGVTHGACVSALASGNYGAVAAALCNSGDFRKKAKVYKVTWDNNGACVGDVRAYLESLD
jgi:hypothetical protein